MYGRACVCVCMCAFMRVSICVIVCMPASMGVWCVVGLYVCVGGGEALLEKCVCVCVCVCVCSYVTT